MNEGRDAAFDLFAKQGQPQRGNLDIALHLLDGRFGLNQFRFETARDDTNAEQRQDGENGGHRKPFDQG